MPRDGSSIYHKPSPDVAPDTTIESSVYNAFVNDVEQDLNAARPIIAGGTGATNPQQASVNLNAAATQVVTNFDSHLWYPGMFRAGAAAAGSPAAGHAFAGWAYSSDAIAYPPANLNVVVEARDLDDTLNPGALWTREKKAGVWGAWANVGADVAADLTDLAAAIAAVEAAKVNRVGDTMTGPLIVAPATVHPMLVLNKAVTPGLSAHVVGQRNGVARWILGLGTTDAETGVGNAGSSFVLERYNDAGALLNAPLSIDRGSGQIAIVGPVAFGGGPIVAADKATFESASGFTEETLTYATSIVWDTLALPAATLLLTGNATMAAPTNVVAGFAYTLRIDQGAGGFAVAWASAGYKFAAGLPPVITATAGAVDRFTFIGRAGNILEEAGRSQGVA